MTPSLSIVPHYDQRHPPRYRELTALAGRRRPVGEEEEESRKNGKKEERGDGTARGKADIMYGKRKK